MRTKESETGGDAFSPGEHPHLFQTWEPQYQTHRAFFKGKLIMKNTSRLIIVTTLTFCVMAPLSRAVCTQTCEEVGFRLDARHLAGNAFGLQFGEDEFGVCGLVFELEDAERGLHGCLGREK